MTPRSLSAALIVTATAGLALAAQTARIPLATVLIVDRGQDDAGIAGATVRILTPGDQEVESGVTDATGRFPVNAARDGQPIKVVYSKLGYVRNPDTVVRTIRRGESIVGPLIRSQATSAYYRTLGVRLARLHPLPIRPEDQAAARDDEERLNSLEPGSRELASTTLLAERERTFRGPVAAFTFEDIPFEPGQYTLSERAKRIIDEMASEMKRAEVQVVVEGHTNNVGSAEENLALGGRRAEAVRDYLIQFGIAPRRITTVSYGEERPKFDNSRPETRRLNDRADLTVRLQ